MATVAGVELLEPIELNLFRPEFRAEPRPLFHLLRSTHPVHWSDAVSPGMWLISCHRDALTVLRDRRFGKRDYWDALAAERSGESGAAVTIVRRWMSQLDPPDHTSLRRTFAQAFTRRSVERLRPVVERVARELLDRIPDSTPIDLVEHFAFPLPATVICAMLGVPASDRGEFRDWSERVMPLFDAVVDDAQIEDANRAASEFFDYFARRIAARDAADSPTSDLLTVIVDACRSETLSRFDAAANAMFLVFAGHGTTMFLIANAVHCLLRHPDQLAVLRARPQLLGGCIEEVLRYEGPVQFTSRIATEDVALGGQTVRRGQQVVVLDGAVNCDPGRYEEPDRFDIERRPSAHVAFGGGVHTCLGAHLARLEAAVAVSVLLETFPSLELAGEEPTWNERAFLRGPTSLIVRCQREATRTVPLSRRPSRSRR